MYNYFGESEEEEREGKKITEGGEKRKETGQEKDREREGGRGREWGRLVKGDSKREGIRVRERGREREKEEEERKDMNATRKKSGWCDMTKQ